MTGMKVVEDVRPPLGERNDVVERQMVSLRADTLGYGLLADVLASRYYRKQWVTSCEAPRGYLGTLPLSCLPFGDCFWFWVALSLSVPVVAAGC